MNEVLQQSRGRFLSRALTLVAVFSALGLATASYARAQAYGGGVPYHESAGAACGDGTGARTILAYPARRMTTLAQSSDPRALEYVYWRADLFVYTTTGWRLYSKAFPYDSANGNKPWFYAVANTFIYTDTWRNYQSGYYQSFVRFSDLPVGWYAVRETFQWQDGTSVQEFARFSQSYSTSTMCNAT